MQCRGRERLTGRRGLWGVKGGLQSAGCRRVQGFVGCMEVRGVQGVALCRMLHGAARRWGLQGGAPVEVGPFWVNREVRRRLEP